MNLPDRREAMVLRIPDRYWRGLVGRAVVVGDATGQAVVDRTNRVIGQSLATTKQGFRRWLARAHLGGKSR